MTTLDDINKRLDRIEKMTATSKNVLTLGEAAALTGYSVRYFRLLVSRGELPSYRRGNRLYFDRAEVENWMTASRIPSNEEITNQAAASGQRDKRKKKNE
jgi:excisionase family DNA binding protein